MTANEPMPLGVVVEATFIFEKETKGALRFQEIDEKGKIIEQAWAKIGTLYLRKNAFARGAKFPKNLSVTIQCSGEVEATPTPFIA